MKSKVKLIKSMYPCQDMPVVVLENRCPKPCLYCDLCSKKCTTDETIAVGTKDVLEKLKNYEKAYFSAVTDCFLEKNKNITHNLLKNIWKIKKGFTPLVITKQIIPKKTIKLLIENKKHANVFVSLPSLNDRLLSLLEPGAAPVAKRLATIEKLTSKGVRVVAVIMPWFNIYEEHENIEDLPKELARVGVKDCVVGTGVLPEIQKQKFLNTKNKAIIEAVAGMTDEKKVTTKTGYTIPFKKRIKVFKKLIKALSKYGIKDRICTADNPDLINNTDLPLCTKSNRPLCATLD